MVTALLTGEIHMTWIVTAGTVLQHEKAGNVRLLGVTSKERRLVMPHVPPMAMQYLASKHSVGT